MKKKILKIFGAIAIAVASLSMTSCVEILTILLMPELFDTKLSSVTATGINEGAIVSWSNGSISSYGLHLSWALASNENQTLGDITLSQNDNYKIINSSLTNGRLSNGTQYKFTVYLTDSNNEIVDSKSATATPSADASATTTYDGSNASSSFYELPANTSVVTLNDVQGKTITYANVNLGTSSAISSTAVRRYIPAASSGVSASVISRSADSDTDELPEIQTPAIKSFVPPADEDITVVRPRGRSGATSDTFSASNPLIGDTRSIYVDQDSNLTKYEQEVMKLYAIGYDTSDTSTNPKIKALVWVNPSNVAETSSGNKVSIGVIDDIITKFIKNYALEEAIFGTTSDVIITRSGTDNMSSYPTKDYINIVLTDIGKDYGLAAKSQCGVVGYFWAKDYYASSYSSSGAYKSTNEGKYFYIDIPYCNYVSGTNGSYSYDGNGNKVSDTVISTLFHEYQHMINFNQKNMRNNLDTNNCVWYNEMLSMLCEDLLQAQLGLTEKVQDGRIPNFNGYYYYSGAAQYLDQNSWVSYGTAYAFGAWLARNYGGAPLVHEMSTNNKVGIDSVVNAVNEVNHTNLTWNDLFKEYVQAVGFRETYANAKSLPTLNRVPNAATTNITVTPAAQARILHATNTDASSYQSYVNNIGTLTGNITTGINLWAKKYKNVANSTNYYGPILTKIGVNLDLQPTGFIFHPIGNTGTQNSVTLCFTGTSDPNDKVFIFIQDAFSENSADSSIEIGY
ncbi:MAG: hypothetical protein IKP60_02595 [Treponema sp.]|nr:hypothetical protein [Treponema sp.]